MVASKLQRDTEGHQPEVADAAENLFGDLIGDSEDDMQGSNVVDQAHQVDGLVLDCTGEETVGSDQVVELSDSSWKCHRAVSGHELVALT